MGTIIENRNLLLIGLMNTISLTVCVLILATFLASVLAAGILSKNTSLRWAASAIVEILRDIPLFVTVMMVYFVAPSVGLSLDEFSSTVLGLGVWGAGNGAVIIRAGIQSIPNGQREAAASLGLHPFRTTHLIVLPQALRPILPPYLGLVTQLVQATSIGALIGIHELLKSTQILIERSTIMEGGLSPFTLYGFVLCVYYVICWSLSMASSRIESRLGHYEKAVSAAPMKLANQ